MSFSVVLLKNGSAVFTFGSHTPFFAPEFDYIYDDLSPPTLIAVKRVFTIDGVIYGKESEAQTLYNAFLAQIENASSYPDGLQLLQGSTPVVNIQKSTGHDDFKIEKVSLPRYDEQWRAGLRFTVQISAMKKFTRILSGTTVTGLTMTERWSYDEAGLLTQTLTGEVTTLAGSSAQSAAQAFALALPGSTFGFVTNGPKGCDVEQIDQGDTKARFTSTIQQAGSPLPANVGPSFSVDIETTIADGEKITRTTVSAIGSGAEAAVAAQLPAGAEATSQTKNAFKKTASAVYVTRKPASGDVNLKSHQFTASGGDRPSLFTQRSGGRSPLEHKGSFKIVEIEESITIELVGIPSSKRFKYPPPVNGLNEDRSRLSISAPYLVQQGKDLNGHRWAMDVRRVYFAKDFKAAFAAIASSAFSARASSSLIFTDPDKETAAQQSGKD